MSFYLAMDGVDDRILIPQMEITAIEMVFASHNTKISDQQRYWSFPLGASFLMRNAGLDEWHSTVSSVTVNGQLIPTNKTVFIPSFEKVTVRSNLSSTFNQSIHIFNNNGNTSYVKGKLYSIKVFNGEVLQAHYDMSTGTVNDISGNNRHATLFGGVWTEDTDDKYYLYMNGMGDKLVMNKGYAETKSKYNVLISSESRGILRYIQRGAGNRNFGFNANGTVYMETLTSAKINGVDVVNGVTPFPFDEKITIELTYATNSWNNRIFVDYSGTKDFVKGNIYDITYYSSTGNIIAYFDMSTGSHLNQGSDNSIPTLTGGTWVLDRVVQSSPIVTITSVSKTKISDEPDMNQSIVTIKFDQDVTEYVARLNGVSYNTGLNVHQGGALLRGQEGQVIIDWDELTDEGVNTVYMYGKNKSGLWTGQEAITQPESNSFIYTRDNILIALVGDYLYWSDNLDGNFTKRMSIAGISPIKYIHVFEDNTVMFCTHTKAYYSTDFITYSESTLLDQYGSPLTLTGYDNLSNFNHNQNGTMIINGVEIHAWGNYSIHSDTVFSNIRMWYTRDKGRTVKVARRFGGYDGSEVVRHLHFVTINQEDKSFWIGTGDNIYETTEERHLIRATYNTATDTWTWQRIGSGYEFKITNLVFYEGYAYWAWDVPQGGVIKAPISSIGNVSTHQKILITANDTNDIVISERGELLVFQTIWGGTETAKNFYYSPDRVNFYKIYGTMPESHDTANQSLYYSVRPPNANGKVLAGVVSFEYTPNFEDWASLPSVYIDDMVRASGFPNALKPLSMGNLDIMPPILTLVPDKEVISPTETLTINASEQCSIYYTLNGTTPTESSTKYTAPISITTTGNVTLKYFGVDASGNRSPIVTKNINVSNNAGKIVTTGLVAYWNSKQGITGNTWRNIAPTTTGSFNATTTGTTVTSDGMSFASGNNSYASFPVPTSITATTDVTLELRLKLPSYSVQAEILSYSSTYSLYLMNSRIYFEISKDAIGVHHALPSTPNEEMIITIRRRQSDGYMEIYKNGVLLDDRWSWGDTPNRTFFPQNTFNISRAFNASGWHMSGIVDNIRIYNRLLTNQEILQNYAVGREVGL